MQRRRKLLLCALFVLLSAELSFAQQDASKTQANPDVLRTNTELVQTGVSVFDKQGHFVDGLTRPDFELEVEGRRVPISFFENIVAGSVRDREARIVGSEPNKQERSSPVSVRHRTIVFFI